MVELGVIAEPVETDVGSSSLLERAGVPQENICPRKNCFEGIGADWKYCRRCGYQLKEDEDKRQREW